MARRVTVVAALLTLGLSCLGASPRPVAAAGSLLPPIEAVMLSGDAPAMIYYLPTEPARVTAQLARWLAAATPTRARPPRRRGPRVVLMDYLGPARLYFTNAAGRRMEVAPADYLTEGADHAVRVHYLPDVVAYGPYAGPVRYLRSPGLYRYLRDDADWHRQFAVDSYTPPEARAIVAALRSAEGRLLPSGFPATPGVAPDTYRDPAAAAPVYATLETRAQPAGHDVLVTFSQVWADGRYGHTWRFWVTASGRVVRERQSGPPVPPS
jgi:hypothetical protein